MAEPTVHERKDQRKDQGLLRAIGVFKLFKGLGLIALGIVFLVMVRPAPASQPGDDGVVAQHVHSPVKVFERLVDRARHLTHGQRQALVTATFVYAGLYLVEGVGLLLRRRWAEWMVVVMTGLLIPLELYEVFHKPTLLHGAVLAVNVVVLIYLVHHLRATHTLRGGAESAV